VKPTHRLRFLPFRTGARESPPPVLSVSNGGSVDPTRYSRFFSFRSGAVCGLTLPPVSLVSNGGGVNPTRRP